MSKRWKELYKPRTDRRHTVARPFSISGFGLHTGKWSKVTVVPADAGKGITFFRSDRADLSAIPATLDYVTDSRRRTVLARGNNVVSTVEHLLAALHANGVDDAYVQMEGDEVPMMDGSAQAFSDEITGTGLTEHESERWAYVLDQPISLRVGEATYDVVPAATSTLTVTIHFDHPLIGTQSIACGLTTEDFREELAGARTFGFLSEATELRGQQLIQGVAVDNAVILTDSGLLDGQTLRWSDEFVRHKALDLIGDLSLLGMPVRGQITAVRPSHAGNIQLARAIAAAGQPTRESQTPA